MEIISKKQLSSLIGISALLFAAILFPLQAEDWPGWRGPANNGISSENGLATSWSKNTNVAWRLALPGPAPSTPVIAGKRIFLTSAEGGDLVVMGISTSGKVLWKQKAGSGNKDIRQGESNVAAPSPSTDGKHLWAFFGNGLLICYDLDGQEVWRTDLQKRYGAFSMYWGMATSPLLDGDRLYIQLMHDNAQVVLALDKHSGKEIWKHRRKTDARSECLHSYASPVIYRHNGSEQLLTHGSDYIVAHRLSDGAEVWRCGGLQSPGNYNDWLRLVATPAVAPGLIVVPSAKNGPILGINPEGASGNITAKKANYHWKWDQQTSDVPSPIIHDGLVYMCRENGVLICIDAKTGSEVYKESVYRKRHRGSPVYADGHIYLTAMDGAVNVIKAGREYKLVATNKINERTSASPAISDGVIYLRSAEALYAIAQKP